MPIPQPSEGMRRLAHVFAGACTVANLIWASQQPGGVFPNSLTDLVVAIVALAVVYLVAWGTFRVLYRVWRWLRDGFATDRGGAALAMSRRG